jgi:arylsulfatase A-like enzyme
VGPAAGQPRAVRSGDWKYIQDGSKQLLFDVTRDLAEREDLAARYPDRVRRLKAMLDAWEKDVGGTVAPSGR